jgi:DNA-binding GntR family transcriptional regulator
MLPRILARPSLHDRTTAALRDLIVEGKLAPGSRLVEAELCKRLSVSRTPLREAYKVLASEGLVELHAHRGAMVSRVTPQETIELFDVLANLESMAASRACLRMSKEQLARLRLVNARLAEWYAAGRRHDYFELNHRIHRAIVALAGNRVLAETHDKLIARARRSRYQAILAGDRWEESLQEHDRLMEAFLARDADAAESIWRQHVLRTGEVFAEVLAEAESRAAAKSV